MSTRTVIIGGNKVVLNMDRPGVADAVAALVEACAERHFPIGMVLEHENNSSYILTRITGAGGHLRAYLIGLDNGHSGIARNSRKIVMVQDPKGGEFGRGYVTDLPAENDRFYDPEGTNGEFLDY